MFLMAAGVLLTIPLSAQVQEPPPGDALSYQFINKTNGKFADEQCF
jgi:hypothetical protein